MQSVSSRVRRSGFSRIASVARRLGGLGGAVDKTRGHGPIIPGTQGYCPLGLPVGFGLRRYHLSCPRPERRVVCLLIRTGAVATQRLLLYLRSESPILICIGRSL